MLGFIIFLICLLIVVILVKWILQELLPGNPRALQIALLLLLLLVIVWFAGYGGWGYLSRWHL